MPKLKIEPPLSPEQCIHGIWLELMGPEGLIETCIKGRPYYDSKKTAGAAVSRAVIAVDKFFCDYKERQRSLREGHNEITRIGRMNANNSQRFAGKR